MIITTFNTGRGKSKGPLNYLLGNDKDNKQRDPAPEIVKGDRKLTEILIDSNTRKYKYTSGAISFRDNEKPTQQQIEKIIEAFERTFTPNLQERVPIFWVKHQDKGNTELHFIAPMQDAKTGKQFNICPPGEQFQQMFKDFQALANDKYGWEQVRPSLFKTEMSKVEALAEDNKNIKKILSKELEKKIKTGELNHRNDLMDYLKNIGFEITRVGKDYISLKYKKAKKATRFKGPVFSFGANYQDLLKQFSQPTKLTDTERTEIKTRLARACKNRERSLLEQLDNQPKQRQQEHQQEPQQPAQQQNEETQIAINRTLIEEQHKQAQPAADLPQSKKPIGFKL